jgi:hypothetical protein
MIEADMGSVECEAVFTNMLAKLVVDANCDRFSA